MEQWSLPRYPQNFADLLNVQFANKVVETVQKKDVSSKSNRQSELISKTHRVAKAKPQAPHPNACNTGSYSQKPAVVTLQETDRGHLLKKQACQSSGLYRTNSSSSEEASLPNTGSKTSIALTTLGLGLLSMSAAFLASRKTKRLT